MSYPASMVLCELATLTGKTKVKKNWLGREKTYVEERVVIFDTNTGRDVDEYHRWRKA